MSLASLSVDQTFRVTLVRGDSPLSIRLMEMGLIEGAEGRLMGRAPLGDPLHIRLGDEYDLSVRKSEAELVEVVSI